jgi:hypothetical protein
VASREGQFGDALARIIDACPTLPEPVKAGILAIIVFAK